MWEVPFTYKCSSDFSLVYEEVGSVNKAATRIFEKFDFVKIGTFKVFFKIGSKWMDLDLMLQFV